MVPCLRSSLSRPLYADASSVWISAPPAVFSGTIPCKAAVEVFSAILRRILPVSLSRRQTAAVLRALPRDPLWQASRFPRCFLFMRPAFPPTQVSSTTAMPFNGVVSGASASRSPCKRNQAVPCVTPASLCTRMDGIPLGSCGRDRLQLPGPGRKSRKIP